MHFTNLAGACLLAFASVSWAESIPQNQYLWGADRLGKMVKRATTTSAQATSTRVADAACTHGPLSRSCWSNGFSIATDFDQKHPVTGNTVSHSIELTDGTCNPDGNGNQPCIMLNGAFTGPAITANWGDTLRITVKNSMSRNGTSMHWHGIRQLNSVGMDGVNGITECPIAPGQSKTYEFLCTQFGTSWYHSHYSSQYGEGVIGPIVINGPASSNYDIDLGPAMINDWYYKGAWQVNADTLNNLQAGAPPPPSDNILINGKTVKGSGGSMSKFTLTKGKKHRLRIINASVDNFLRVKLDNHTMTVISADFIPTKTIAGQEWLLLGVGQRYDVIITANAAAGNYLFRAEVAGDCYSASNGAGRALFTYSGQTAVAPTDAGSNAPGTGCKEVVTVPYWKQAVDSSLYTSQIKTLGTFLTQAQVTTNGQNLVVWGLDTNSMKIEWDHPTIQYVMEGNTSYPDRYNVIEIPNENVWTYWVVQQAATNPPPPHPIHLHGHDFFVLGSGSGQYDGSTAGLNFVNPPRRDTTTLPSGGYVIMAFVSNNPGAWLMHCHIAWHIAEGLGVQFLESKNSIVMPESGQFKSQCDAWKKYAASTSIDDQDDSGL